VRDGEPEALAGLCDRRGPAVLAYCEVIAGPGPRAFVAAAEALGSFRAGVFSTQDLGNLNPEALLLSATRHAAARHAGIDSPLDCARLPVLLAARADRSITLSDHDWLERHLANCWTCRAPVARFEAAERAYHEPSHVALGRELAAAMIDAMVAAAPIAAHPETYAPDGEGLLAVHVESATSLTNGSAPHAQPDAPPAVSGGDGAATEDVVTPAPDLPAGPVDQPTAPFAIGIDNVASGDPPDAPSATPASRPDRGARIGAPLGALRLGRSQGARSPQPASPATAGVGPSSSDASPAAPAGPRAAGGTSLPRPSRATAAGAPRRRDRSALRPGLILPVVLVILAIVLALLVAGVFGGDDPTPAPRSSAPSTSTPADTASPTVLVVPGATDASPVAVERAKARARAARRRAQRDGTPTPAPPAPTDAAPSAAAPPAADAPAAAATPPPPAPRRAPENGGGDTGTGGSPKIDAGDGATGEQIPEEDATATVPDLAPPAQPAATPPG